MIHQTEKIYSYLFLLLPFFLITGPAIPDVIISTGAIFAILYIIFLRKYKQIFHFNILRITILFWISLIFISFFAYNKTISFQDSIIFIRFLLIPISIYFIFFKNNKYLDLFLLFIFVIVVLVCLDTLYQFFNYSSKEGFGKDLLGFKSTWYGRLTGPFGDELIPGSYVSKFGLLGYVFLISKKKLSSNIFIQSSYLSLILLVTYVSGERMAFATFSLGLAFLFIFLNEHRKSILISIILGVILIFSIIKLHPFYNDFKVIESKEYHQGLKIEKKFKCEENSQKMCTKIIEVQPNFIEVIKNFNTSAYGEIYLLSIKMFADNPITGIGLNNYKYLCKSNNSYKNLMTNYNCASHPHNIYIQWLTEGGIIVFLFFILYLFYLIYFLIFNNGERKYKIISLVIILIMFWPVMSTGSLIKNWYGISTFFIIGICMNLSSFRKYY